MDASKSLARRRLRLSQASVRFDDSAARQDLEAVCVGGSFDDRERPATELAERGLQFVSGIAAAAKTQLSHGKASRAGPSITSCRMAALISASVQALPI